MIKYCILAVLVAAVAGCATQPKALDGYSKVGFDYLASFPLTGSGATVDLAASEARIPSAIKRLDGEKVIVTGFMLPIKLDSKFERTTEFLLMDHTPESEAKQRAPLSINKWVLVEMPRGARPLMDTMVSFSGTLHVRPVVQSGYIMAIYSLDGDKMVGHGG